MRTGGIHPEAGADGPRRGALCQAEAVNTSPKTQSGKAVTVISSFSQWIPWIANTTSSVLFLEKNCRWFTTCLNKTIYNLAVLFVELKDHFKSSCDWVPDHLRDRNLVWTQLSFPTTLRIIKDMETLPFGQRGIQEEHTQIKIISPAVSNALQIIHSPSFQRHLDFSSFSVEWWEHAQGILIRCGSSHSRSQCTYTKKVLSVLSCWT